MIIDNKEYEITEEYRVKRFDHNILNIKIINLIKKKIGINK